MNEHDDTMRANDEPARGAAAKEAARGLFARQLAGATGPDGILDREALLDRLTEDAAQARTAGEAQAAHFGAVLENMAQGLCLFDGEQRLVVCNARYAEIYRLAPGCVSPGTTLEEIVQHRHVAGTNPAMAPSDYLLWRDEVAGRHLPHASVVELLDGRRIAIRYQPMPDGGWVATHEDITERLETERRLGYLGRHDAVTGLPNRLSLTEQLQDVLGRTSEKAPCAILSLSLGGLRAVNETLGRPVGDEVVRIMADRLRQHLGPTELLGLQGANEFVIVQSGTVQPAAATRLAETLLKLIAEPSTLDGQQVVVSASIGIAVALSGGQDAEALMKNADIALKSAKTESRGNYRLFEPEMDRLVQARRLLEADLREAVSKMAFQLHYQPQVDARSRRVKGFEALLRWDHPVRGSVLPRDFIALAEELGLIGYIGEWVLRRACVDATSWPEDIGIAVNVSALQLRDDTLPGVVAAALELSGLSPSRLELEITETCMVESAGFAAAMLRDLRSSGVRVAMDDFGTGFSSLGALPSLPFDKIKIDRSLVSRLGEGPAHTAIIRAVITLSASLGVTCLAEGVETEEQLALLAAERCTEVQGYLLGRPGPAESIPAVLRGFGSGQPYQPGELAAKSHSGFGVDDIVFSQIVQTANDVIIVTDANLSAPGPEILYVNSAFTRLTGFEPHEAIGRSPRILQGPGTSRCTLDEIVARLRAGQEVQRKVLNYAKHGAPYWLDLRIVPLRDAQGKIFQFAAIERDVTLDKRRLDELEYVADRDTLTGIPNRRSLLRAMDAELQAYRVRGGAGPCLAFIDVDNFKRINDQHGHATGDAVLFGIADRLAENIRRVDMVGRFGGEEFAVWMPALQLEDAAAAGERLRHAVAANAFETPSGPVHATVSVGVARADDREQGLRDLLDRADRAMYAAKHSGRDQVVTDQSPSAMSDC